MLLNTDLIAEPQNVAETDPVNNLCRGTSKYLFRKDMVQAFSVVRIQGFHMVILVQADSE